MTDTRAGGACWQAPRSTEALSRAAGHRVNAAIGQVQAAAATVQANWWVAVIIWHLVLQVEVKERRPGGEGQVQESQERMTETEVYKWRKQTGVFLSSGRQTGSLGPLFSLGSGGIGRLSSSLRSAVTRGHPARFYPWVSPPLLCLALCLGQTLLQCAANVAEQWTPHTHTHTRWHRFSRSAIESKTQKLFAAYHFFSLHFFFSFGWFPRDGGRELKRTEGRKRGGWGQPCDW